MMSANLKENGHSQPLPTNYHMRCYVLNTHNGIKPPSKTENRAPPLWLRRSKGFFSFRALDFFTNRDMSFLWGLYTAATLCSDSLSRSRWDGAFPIIRAKCSVNLAWRSVRQFNKLFSALKLATLFQAKIWPKKVYWIGNLGANDGGWNVPFV